jgi:hypothetical protein
MVNQAIQVLEVKKETMDITDMKTPDNAVSDDDEYQYLTWDEFYDDCSYEFYNRHFTSPSGDKMVAWGYYGYD